MVGPLNKSSEPCPAAGTWGWDVPGLPPQSPGSRWPWGGGGDPDGTRASRPRGRGPSAVPLAMPQLVKPLAPLQSLSVPLEPSLHCCVSAQLQCSDPAGMPGTHPALVLHPCSLSWGKSITPFTSGACGSVMLSGIIGFSRKIPLSNEIDLGSPTVLVSMHQPAAGNTSFATENLWESRQPDEVFMEIFIISFRPLEKKKKAQSLFLVSYGYSCNRGNFLFSYPNLHVTDPGVWSLGSPWVPIFVLGTGG